MMRFRDGSRDGDDEGIDSDMSTRRQLLLLGGGLTLWVGGFRLVPELASRIGGFKFVPLEQVPGFRKIASSAGVSSSGSGGFDVTLGLTPDKALPAGLVERLKAAPEKALFQVSEPKRATPVAYFFDYYCPYCRILSRHLDDLVAASEIALKRHHWPIFGDASILAARASLAAEMQDGADALHQRLLRVPGRVAPGYLQKIVQEIGLSWPRLAEDMQSRSVTAALDQTRALARLFSFIGTPSLVIGKTVVQGEISKAHLRDLVSLERPES